MSNIDWILGLCDLVVKKQSQITMESLLFLAEAVRFELTNVAKRRRFSRPVPSTARPHLQKKPHYKRVWLTYNSEITFFSFV